MTAHVTPFDRLGRFVVRRARLVIGAWAVLIARWPCRSRRRRRARSAPVASSATTSSPPAPRRSSRPSSGRRRRRSSSSSRARRSRPARRPSSSAAAAAMRDIPAAPHVAGVVSHLLQPRQVSADRHTAYDIVLLDLPPDDSPKALPILRERLRAGPGPDGRAGRRPGVLRRRPDGQRAGPPAQRAHLAAAGRARAPARLRVARGGRASRSSSAGRASSSRWPAIFLDRVGHADEHLRAQPRHAPGPRPRRRLLPAHDQPVPRGAGARGPRRPEADVAEAVRIDRRDRRPGRVLQRPDGPARAARPGALRVHDPALASGSPGRSSSASRSLAALTLLPALLTVIGPRLDRFAVRRVSTTPESDGSWARLARRVMRRPVAVLIPTLALLLLLGVAVPARPVQRPGREHPAAGRPVARRVRPPPGGVRRGRVRADHRWPSGPTATRRAPRTSPRLYDYSRRTRGRPARAPGRQPRRRRATADPRAVPAPVRRPERPARPVRRDGPGRDDPGRPDGVHASPRRTARTAPRAGRSSRDLRDPSSAIAPPPGFTVLVGGGAADVADVVDGVAADFPRTALFIIVTTYLVLFALLRSVVLPAKALVMNTLSIIASFGALVWIFQDGNLSAPLGFAPLGFVETTQPVILFCVLFGLSMDYEVFLLTRMKEVWDATGDNTEAVARGLERSGRIVTSRGAHRRGRGRLVRVRRHRAHQGARARRRHRGGPRRDRRARAAGARDDAAPRAAGTGGCRRGWSGSSAIGCRRRRPRPRRRPSDEAPAASRAAPVPPSQRCSSLGGVHRRLHGRRPDPGQPDRAAPIARTAAPTRRSASPIRSPSSCRATTARTTA